MGGDDLGSDDEYLFETGSLRGTAVSSDDGSVASSDDDGGGGGGDDDRGVASSALARTPASLPSKKRKGGGGGAAALAEGAPDDGDDDDDDDAAPSSKKRKKKGRDAPPPPSSSSSKNLLIRAGRGIALDEVDAQATFLGTLYAHHTKLSESGNGNRDDDDDDDEGEGEDEANKRSSPEQFSFAPHLYVPPASFDKKTIKFQRNDLAAFLKGGALPSNKRLKNWRRPRSPMVLVVCLSARRCVELTKQLSALKLPVCKLFAKHMAVEDQVAMLEGVGGKKSVVGGNFGNGGKKGRGRCYSLAVGTPGRLLKLLRHGGDGPDGGGGALRLRHTEVVVLDCHEDSKGWTVCTLPDTSRELMEFLREGAVPQMERRRGKIKLAMF